MKLWIDDVRPAPEGWTWVKTVNMAKEYLMGNCWFSFSPGGSISGFNTSIEAISLDHDAGDYAKFGGDYIEILNYMEETEYETHIKFNIPIHLHSQNPVGVQNMRAIIQKRGWKEIMEIEHKAVALKELSDEDWKTQLALGYPNIPKGAEVSVVDYFNNCYGHFVRVKYNNRVYDVREEDIKRKE